MYTYSKNILSKAVTWVFLKGPSSFSSAYTRLVSLIRSCMWWHVSSVLFESSSPADKLSLSLEREHPSPSPNTVRYIGGITPLPFTHTKAYHSRQVMGLPPDRDTKEAEEAPPPARRQPVFQSFCSGGTPAAVNYDPGGVGEEEHCARGARRQEEARRRRRERQQNQAVRMQILLTLSFSKLPFLSK